MPQPQTRPPAPTICRNCGYNAMCHRCGADPNADPLPRYPWQTVCFYYSSKFLFIFALLVFFFCFISILIFTYLLETSPKPESPVFGINSLVLSNNTLNLRLNITNPNNNNVSVSYNHVDFSVYYRRDIYLGGGRVAPFIQVGPGSTMLDVTLPNLDAAALVAGPAGFLNLAVNGTVKVIFRDRVRNLRGKHGGVSVQCDNVGVMVAPYGGEMIGDGGGAGDMFDCEVNCGDCYLIPLWMDTIANIANVF